MKTEICKTTAELVEIAVKTIQNQLNKKPDSVLVLACGETMKPLWAALAERKLPLRETRILCVTELCGVEESKTCRHALTEGLLDKTDADPANCFFPDAAAPEAYDRLIETLGGIDLAILGIGEDCHIGYNEPGTLFESRTHVQKLTDRTRRQLLKRGFTDENMPETAVTMGIHDLTQARKILLVASGEDKSAAVYQMLYAKTTPYIPAAFLQIPLEVTVLLDEAAAGKL
ncbi:MAG: glucosamine-6-phosphate deaminase [Oscillospiraceae bacterium]|nr:glucosamine-6-phosphate deaminase [Oscillospiraceae bacterium]